ncbi:protein of unknown function [Pararobbsia alpina]
MDKGDSDGASQQAGRGMFSSVRGLSESLDWPGVSGPRRHGRANLACGQSRV